jgi:hypothetical protein
MIFQFS